MANFKSLDVVSSGSSVEGTEVVTKGRTITIHISADSFGADGTVNILASPGTASPFVFLDDPLTTSGKSSYDEDTVRIIEGFPASWLIRLDLEISSGTATDVVGIIAD